MPELPEVETTKRGISPFLIGKTIETICVRQPRLRLLVPPLDKLCKGQKVLGVERRAKYILVELTHGYLLIHLGMSGHLRLVNSELALQKHDHIDMVLNEGPILRYNDPRRFGLWLYIDDEPLKHPLLSHLGPEPLSDTFNTDYLSRCAYKKQQNIKSFIMRNDIVVGVGNIYATESLFLAGIHPQTAAGQLRKEQFDDLIIHIKAVLEQAILVGGTTLKDFYTSDGKPGYFANHLQVYGRKNLPCFQCNHLIQAINLGGRNSAFCPHCQPLSV